MDTIPLNDLGRHNAALRDQLGLAAREVVEGGWYVLGGQGERFERKFAEYCAVPHCVGVANGTDAIELALRCLKVGAHSRVLTVANAGMYSTIAIRSTGAVPVFVDVDPSTLCMDPTSLKQALACQPDAVVVTHLYGRLADAHTISGLCAEHGVPLIEDCAQAHGAQRDGRKAGSFGVMGCFSFYPTKNLGALGDAGAVVTADDALAKRLRQLRQYGWESKYTSAVEGGRNSRMDEIQAAFLSAKLPQLDAWNKSRRRVASQYSQGIQNPRLHLPGQSGDDFVAHLYVIRTAGRNGLREHLRRAGIASDIHYPLADHRQPCIADRFADVALPNTELATSQVLTLPCFPEMTDAEVQRVIEACNTWHD
ncbi:MAG: DegT/DnrJ/EryC1/StrS family aminotransferase [Dokdonella sp.]|nr:MAG: DegT/DnrJ/EryC1/StrS family aminotransferase [Gammaproteobacteria bacterium]TXI75217.1 MAG: DegT/DnrJ/EryC1/StrS family aminotransferase [Dokdonella sp.]